MILMYEGEHFANVNRAVRAMHGASVDPQASVFDYRLCDGSCLGQSGEPQELVDPHLAWSFSREVP